MTEYKSKEDKIKQRKKHFTFQAICKLAVMSQLSPVNFLTFKVAFNRWNGTKGK